MDCGEYYEIEHYIGEILKQYSLAKNLCVTNRTIGLYVGLERNGELYGKSR